MMHVDNQYLVAPVTAPHQSLPAFGQSGYFSMFPRPIGPPLMAQNCDIRQDRIVMPEAGQVPSVTEHLIPPHSFNQSFGSYVRPCFPASSGILGQNVLALGCHYADEVGYGHSLRFPVVPAGNEIAPMMPMNILSASWLVSGSSGTGLGMGTGQNYSRSGLTLTTGCDAVGLNTANLTIPVSSSTIWPGLLIPNFMHNDQVPAISCGVSSACSMPLGSVTCETQSSCSSQQSEYSSPRLEAQPSQTSSTASACSPSRESGTGETPARPAAVGAGDGASPAPAFPCGGCGGWVGGSEQAVLCEAGCNAWYHRTCTGLLEEAYLLLITERFVEWVCDRCLGSGNVPVVKQA